MWRSRALDSRGKGWTVGLGIRIPSRPLVRAAAIMGLASSAASVAMVAFAALAILSFGCAGSAVPDPQTRIRETEEFASSAGFRRLEPEFSDETSLPVAAWVRRAPSETDDALGLHIYIEGDGLAWQSRRRFSLDPTPVQATALRLAAADPSPTTIIYLGRPCQYGFPSTSDCRPILWTSDRHGEAVIEAMDHRIDELLVQLGNRRPLTLIGYSGGGVVAALLAARRDDVRALVTIAAPLDLDGWTRNAHVSALAGSLSPMDRVHSLRNLRQHHFVGRNDAVVPVAATEAFHRALGSDAPSRLTIVEEMDHVSWPGAWRSLVEAHALFE